MHHIQKGQQHGAQGNTSPTPSMEGPVTNVQTKQTPMEKQFQNVHLGVVLDVLSQSVGWLANTMPKNKSFTLTQCVVTLRTNCNA
eukprot:5943092-Amphidinium_carterae.1